MSETDEAGSSAAENLKAAMKKHVKHEACDVDTFDEYMMLQVLTQGEYLLLGCGKKKAASKGLVKLLFEGQLIKYSVVAAGVF